MQINDLDHTLIEFLESFEEVFGRDWAYTKQVLGISDESEETLRNMQEMGLETIYMIEPGGTFIDPKVDDETEDWGNRGQLLKTYRKLKELVNQNRPAADGQEQAKAKYQLLIKNFAPKGKI